MFSEDTAYTRRFAEADLDTIRGLVYSTIDACSSDVYPQEAIQFFKDFHAPEKILNDANIGFMLVMEWQDQIIGTGTLIADHVYRVFVLPAFQKRGYGKHIMSRLEGMAESNGIDTVKLDSSLVSKRFYDDLGYKTTRETFIELSNGKRLDYYEMQKQLKRGTS